MRRGGRRRRRAARPHHAPLGRARAFSSGNSWSLTSVALAPASPVARTRIRAEATARGLVRALGGTGRIAVGAVTGSVAHRAKGTRTLARGAGMVAGAFGWSYQEYARRD